MLSKKLVSAIHRKKIKTEEKTKVVTYVRGEEFILFLAKLAFLGRFFFQIVFMQFIVLFKIVLGKIACVARN